MRDLSPFLRHLAGLRSPSTTKTYKTTLVAFFDREHRRDVSTIFLRSDAEAFLTRPREDGGRRSASAWNRELAALRAFAAFARTAHAWPNDPTEGIAFQREPDRDPTFLTAFELRRLFGVLEEEALTGGRCWASADLCERESWNKERCTRPTYPAHGRQALSVKVTRNQASDPATSLWLLDPENEETWTFPVPTPKDSEKGNGSYRVEIVASGSAPGVTYFAPFAPKTDPVGDPTQPELRYEARLQPRGPYSWRIAPIRTFITVPVSITGIRFPMSQADRRTSTENVNYQLTSPSVGLLLGCELWDYALQKNTFYLAPRLLSGFQFYKGASNFADMSFLLGASIGLPIIEGSEKIPTSTNIGLFWERDLRAGGGNHFLVTLGFQFFSLLGNP